MPKFAPNPIAPANYNIALAPTKGAEKKFAISPLPSFALGELVVTGQNACTYSPSIADNIQLATRPSNLVAILRTPVNNTNPIALIVNGQDQTLPTPAPLSGVANFVPPVYADNQNNYFPEGWAQDVVSSDNTKLFSKVTSVGIQCDATAFGARVRLFGMPDPSTFVTMGYRVKLDYDPGVREPSPTRDGADASANVKPGDRPVKTFSISGKVPSMAGGFARINGQRVTALAYEDKEDVIITANEYFLGLIATFKTSAPEGAGASDDVMLDGTGIYKDYGLFLAP